MIQAIGAMHAAKRAKKRQTEPVKVKVEVRKYRKIQQQPPQEPQHQGQDV